jgi:hypothetical protein
VPGGALTIDVDPDGLPWVTNSRDDIYRWEGSAFRVIPGAGIDITVSHTKWVIGTNLGLYGWTGIDWTGVSSPCIYAQSLSVGLQEVLWITCDDGSIWRM